MADISDEGPASRHVNLSYRQRRELPPATQPAIAHPATGAAIRLRLVSAAVLVVMMLGLIAGAIAVSQHRSAREQQLLRTGVAVLGRVVAQPLSTTKYGPSWSDDVQWSFASQKYEDSTTLTSSQQSELAPLGQSVTVLLDRHDPSWFSLNGVFTDKARSSVSVALFVIPGLIACLLAIGLATSGARLRAVTRRSPWHPATIVEVQRVNRRNGRLRYTESEIAGQDSHLPLTVRNFAGQPGNPVWVSFGARTYAICRPGAIGLRSSRYRTDG